MNDYVGRDFENENENAVFDVILSELQAITFKDDGLKAKLATLIDNYENREFIDARSHSDDDEKFLTPPGSPNISLNNLSRELTLDPEY